MITVMTIKLPQPPSSPAPPQTFAPSQQTWSRFNDNDYYIDNNFDDNCDDIWMIILMIHILMIFADILMICWWYFDDILMISWWQTFVSPPLFHAPVSSAASPPDREHRDDDCCNYESYYDDGDCEYRDDDCCDYDDGDCEYLHDYCNYDDDHLVLFSFYGVKFALLLLHNIMKIFSQLQWQKYQRWWSLNDYGWNMDRNHWLWLWIDSTQCLSALQGALWPVTMVCNYWFAKATKFLKCITVSML